MHNPNVRFDIVSNICFEIDNERRKRTCDRNRAGLVEIAMCPRPPERERLCDDHRSLADASDLTTGGNVTANPRIEYAAPFVAPVDILVHRHQWMFALGARPYRRNHA